MVRVEVESKCVERKQNTAFASRSRECVCTGGKLHIKNALFLPSFDRRIHERGAAPTDEGRPRHAPQCRREPCAAPATLTGPVSRPRRVRWLCISPTYGHDAEVYMCRIFVPSSRNTLADILLGKAPPLIRPRPRRSVSASPLGHLQKGTPAKRLHRISSPTKQRTPASARRGSRSPQKRRRSAVDAGVREGGVGAWFVSSDHLYSDLRWGFCCQSHLQGPRNLRN